MARIKSGLEVLLEQRMEFVRGCRVGLITNHSAVTREISHILYMLLQAEVNIRALYAPEHGIRGDVPAGKEVPSGTDQKTGLPVYSLFGPTKKPTPEMLKDIDVMVFDVQDIGCRFYTYIYTMSHAMQACAQSNKRFIILDRPNPIGGQGIEGNIPDAQFASFVGMHPIPIRHGMTIGELAYFFNDQFKFLADLQVIKCTGWTRATHFIDTELPWVMPSPNMPTPDTALLYPGTCLIEGTNISEGRGTAKPFEIIGAPWIDPDDLAVRLNSLRLPGVRFRPVYFIPTASKFAQEQCRGVQIHIMQRSVVEPVRIGLHIIKALVSMYPEQIQFLPAGNTGKMFFDLLAGTDKTRLALQGITPVDELINMWYHGLRDFTLTRQKYLMYI